MSVCRRAANLCRWIAHSGELPYWQIDRRSYRNMGPKSLDSWSAKAGREFLAWKAAAGQKLAELEPQMEWLGTIGKSMELSWQRSEMSSDHLNFQPFCPLAQYILFISSLKLNFLPQWLNYFASTIYLFLLPFSHFLDIWSVSRSVLIKDKRRRRLFLICTRLW